MGGMERGPQAAEGHGNNAFSLEGDEGDLGLSPSDGHLCRGTAGGLWGSWQLWGSVMKP